jgi:hypothetical protein
MATSRAAVPMGLRTRARALDRPDKNNRPRRSRFDTLSNSLYGLEGGHRGNLTLAPETTERLPWGNSCRLGDFQYRDRQRAAPRQFFNSFCEAYVRGYPRPRISCQISNCCEQFYDLWRLYSSPVTAGRTGVSPFCFSSLQPSWLSEH